MSANSEQEKQAQCKGVESLLSLDYKSIFLIL